MAPPIVRTISRYLLRQHIAPLGFALAALTSLMLIQQIAKQLSSLLGKGLPTSVIIEVFLLSVPFIVAVTLPMAVLVAVLHVFTRLAADNEITAMQAGGVSVGRVIAPTLAGAAGIALLSFLWNDQLLPRTNHQLRTLQMDIQRKKPSLALKEQVINEVVPGQTFLRASRIDGNTNKLKDVTLYDLSDDLRRLAGLAPLPPSTSARPRDARPPGPYCRALQRLAMWLLPAEAGAQTPRPAPRGAVKPPRPLPPSAGGRVPITPPYIAAGLITPGAGVSEQQRLRGARERAAAYEVEIQKKAAIAVACLVFALVGAPIALRFQRGGVGLVLGVSVAVFTVYYIGLIGGEELGDRLILSPFLAMWTPNLIFATAGLFGLWRIRKPGNSPHGGDWSDLWPAWIGAPWRKPR